LSVAAMKDEEQREAEASSHAPQQGLVHIVCGGAVHSYGNVFYCNPCGTSVGAVGCAPAGAVEATPHDRADAYWESEA
jgi:hypothetical protein